MYRGVFIPLAVGLLCCLGAADAPKPPLEEFHEQVQLDGQKVGTHHFAVFPEGKLYRATATLDLTLKRYGATARLRKEEATVESAEGAVEGVSLRQGAAGGKQLVLTGVLDRDHMHVRVDGGRIDRHIRWPASVVGMRKQQRLFADRKVKPGDRFAFERYEPTYNSILTVRVEVKARETVEVMGERRPLLRAELTPDPLEGRGQTVRPPRAVVWLDDSWSIVRRQQELDGLGTLIFVRTSRENALAGGGAAVDIGTRSLIALDRALTKPYDRRAILYRVTVRDDDTPSSLLVSDEHQEVRNTRGASFELAVRPARPGTRGETKPEIAHLATCHFIDHDDGRVTELARRAVAAEKDPWKIAIRIERWVKYGMRIDNTAALEPASTIARTMRGDCRHHALLTAAMCRAEGLPSRTAIGLLYVFKGGPKLGFHMWTEVLIDGRWLGIDSTLGKGGVSAAHVKVTDHTWYETASLTPLLPVARVMGKLRVEVLRVE